jgi:hypothetical protein
MSVLLWAFPRGLLASRALATGLRAEAAAACRLLSGFSASAPASAFPASPASPVAVAGSISPSISPFRSFASSADPPAPLEPKVYVTSM